MYRFSVFLINVECGWKYLIRESPEIQNRSLLHWSISSFVSSTLSLLCAPKTSLNKCFLPLSCQGSCTLPGWAVFMVLSTFQNESRFSSSQGITLLSWDTQERGPMLPGEVGTGLLLLALCHSPVLHGNGLPHPCLFMYLGPAHSPWHEASLSGSRGSPVLT